MVQGAIWNKYSIRLLQVNLSLFRLNIANLLKSPVLPLKRTQTTGEHSQRKSKSEHSQIGLEEMKQIIFLYKFDFIWQKKIRLTRLVGGQEPPPKYAH